MMTKKGSADIATANHPGIRLFVAPKSLSGKPLKELPGTNLTWRVCNPQNILAGTHLDEKPSSRKVFQEQRITSVVNYIRDWKRRSQLVLFKVHGEDLGLSHGLLPKGLQKNLL